MVALFGVASACARPLEDALAADARKDYATELKILRPLAARRDPIAQFYLGVMYSDGEGVARNDATAVQWFRRSAMQGHVPAQFNLGSMYEKGRGVTQSFATAVKWYRMAAEKGEAAAQSNLGRMFALGHGVPQDFVQAHMWFELAAITGDAEAVHNRDVIAARMTAQQNAAARKLAKDCRDRHFRNCGVPVIDTTPGNTTAVTKP